ncbi:MAG: chromosomal replication initiator protein DnaA [Holophagales bacterium]|nr:chromosomal replication initiator protein DnaA [Holophagales bacterium]
MTLHTAQDIWGRLCQDLARRLPDRPFRDWVLPCKPIAFDGDALWIQTPDLSTKLWLEEQMADEFYDALALMDLPNLKLTFSTGGAKPKEDVAEKPVIFQTPPSPSSESYSLPKGFESYTLENFVVGPNSNMAFSAAVSIIENYGRTNLSYDTNLLFVYGGSGLGKTHLMIGIGKGLVAKHPHIQMAYLKVETFLHELTGAIKANNTEPLRQKYQSKNLLLFDDIQTLTPTMARTQEEIFYIFDYMLQHGKQIVITSDRSPNQLEGLHQRLLTRCKGGLTVDVHPPEFETRIAILKKKLEDPSLCGYPPVPEDVLTFIANKAKGSVRELQGLLKRTLFQADFLGTGVSLAVAQEAYRGATGNEPTASVSIEKICEAVADHNKLSLSDLTKKKSRQKEILLPRQIAMYLARELTTASYAEIGRVFNNMHHSTVMNAIDSVKKRMQRDSDFHREIQGLLNGIG